MQHSVTCKKLTLLMFTLEASLMFIDFDFMQADTLLHLLMKIMGMWSFGSYDTHFFTHLSFYNAILNKYHLIY